MKKSAKIFVCVLVFMLSLTSCGTTVLKQEEAIKYNTISASFNHVVGIKNDGTVIATEYIDFMYEEVSDWADIKLP